MRQTAVPAAARAELRVSEFQRRGKSQPVARQLAACIHRLRTGMAHQKQAVQWTIDSSFCLQKLDTAASDSLRATCWVLHITSGLKCPTCRFGFCRQSRTVCRALGRRCLQDAMAVLFRHLQQGRVDSMSAASAAPRWRGARHLAWSLALISMSSIAKITAESCSRHHFVS